MTVRILIGHVLDRLAELPDESVHCCVTSPPYYGLRDYGIEPQVWDGDPGCEHEWSEEETRAIRNSNGAGKSGLKRNVFNEDSRLQCLANNKIARANSQIETNVCRHCNAWRGSLGLEPTPSAYIEHMVTVFRAVKRVLRKDGTLWLNIGDSYCGSPAGKSSTPWVPKSGVSAGRYRKDNYLGETKRDFGNIKPKDLLGMPWALAFALRDDGWYLRSEITWAKRAPMPESVTDRPTSATEKVFLLTKSPRYFYDAEAVKEAFESERDPVARSEYYKTIKNHGPNNHRADKGAACGVGSATGRNMRNWWLLGPEPFAEAHFATFVTAIPRRAILAGTSERGACPKCGAGWERQTSVSRVVTRPNLSSKYGGPDEDIRRSSEGNVAFGLARRSEATVETIGWRPTCSCGSVLNPVPATVLDPFLGAGTTAMVADQLGRDCIGIELNESYAKMAVDRIRADAGMFSNLEISQASAVSDHCDAAHSPLALPLNDTIGRASEDYQDRVTESTDRGSYGAR